MCAVVMIIASDIKFKNSLSDEEIESYSGSIFTVTEDGVDASLYTWVKEEFFDGELDELYQFAKENSNKLKGHVFIVRKAEDREDCETIQYDIKLGAKDYESDECKFNITVRKQREKKKVLTQDEKLALFKEYWELKRKEPPAKEVYKDFRIGAFYNTCKKNADLLAVLTDIQKS